MNASLDAAVFTRDMRVRLLMKSADTLSLWFVCGLVLRRPHPCLLPVCFAFGPLTLVIIQTGMIENLFTHQDAQRVRKFQVLDE